MNAVKLTDVTKRFGQVVAVDNLSLDVPRGSIYGFIGPNGSGKTTTLRMIMNIFYPDSGRIEVLGGPLHGTCTDRVGYLPEERGLYKRMGVRDLLKFYGRLKSGRNVSRQVDSWLERFDLADWGKKKVETLSKGMSQKVQFIAAVVAEPELIVLDEPFTGLDPVNADVIREAILEMQQQGRTVILSTHDMNVAEQMCDFIFMIFKGKKVLDGTLASIQDQYGSNVLRIGPENGHLLVAEDVEGVESVRDFGQTQEIRIKPGADPQKVLADIMRQIRLKSFEIAKPSLHDIFVQIAGPKAREDSHA
ncbi:MAG: ATP-binding cassette domain-containing protein [Sedimentisphaerales bacterium]|nr:ATP-binding cassette domain-containing protein [Sedimentisphaerales bacterium]